MKISISGMMRWSIRLAVASCVVAIAVGRMCAPAPTMRSLEAARFVSMPTVRGDALLRLLDTQTGVLASLELPSGDILEHAACSPWHDETGKSQVVGLWRTRSGEGNQRVTTEFGLARFNFPGGECLDRVATNILPEGKPCWYPGTTARILFASNDGGLYRFAFESGEGEDPTATGRDLQPLPIVWKITPPGDNERSVRMADPVWPVERAFGGRLVVSLRYEIKNSRGEIKFSQPRPWWLKLDAAGEAIEAAGPLGDDESAVDSGLKVRFPRPIRLADGSFRLATLKRASGRASWDLHVSELGIGNDGAPRVIPGTDVVAASNCDSVPLANSPDGRWVYYLPEVALPGAVLRAPTVARGG
jgi:hypothetical protein